MIPFLRSGMVLGKFLPPHAGHLYLIECARRQVDQLYVVVERILDEPIPSAMRASWMRALVPGAEILHLDRVMPQDPSERPDFWSLWRGALREILPAAPEVVFASEAYGHRLASELGARFLPVDPARRVMPVSGTAVRADPFAHERFLPAPVRAHFGLAAAQAPRVRPRRVALVGPESTGKSTLAARLADAFEAHLVPEHAETMIAAGVADAHALTARDLEDFARGQRASEDTLAEVATRDLLFCDSDALTTQLYAETLLGFCPHWIAQEARERRYELTLLTAPDVPFEDDVHRVDPAGREAFFAGCERALSELGRPYVVVSGAWAARFEAAHRAVRALG